jgi:hypothetical protein
VSERLCLRVGDDSVEVDVAPGGAPRTWAALKALLPLRADLHYARIAGQEIMFIVPFLLPLEHAADVQSLGPGSVAYWPERQLICLYYGPLQEEAASVTVLGRVRDLTPLEAIGERVRARQGAMAEVSACS